MIGLSTGKIEATISSGGTTSTEIDLETKYDKLDIEVPTLTNCDLSLQVSFDKGGTYRPLGVGGTKFATGTTGNFFTTVDIGGFEFIKIISSVAQGSDRVFNVVGIRS
jgi:hypothetical protein